MSVHATTRTVSLRLWESQMRPWNTDCDGRKVQRNCLVNVCLSSQLSILLQSSAYWAVSHSALEIRMMKNKNKREEKQVNGDAKLTLLLSKNTAYYSFMSQHWLGLQRALCRIFDFDCNAVCSKMDCYLQIDGSFCSCFLEKLYRYLF